MSHQPWRHMQAIGMFCLLYWCNGGQLASVSAAPSITVDVWDLSTGTAATGGSVIQGDYLAFRINSNLDQALNPAYRENRVPHRAGHRLTLPTRVTSISR